VTHRDLHLIPDNNQQGETLREFSFTKMVRFPPALDHPELAGRQRHL
jgi:hypothetical protein